MHRATYSRKWIGATLLLASLTDVLLVIIRLVTTGQWKFLYLPFNLFLAWLPMVFALLAWQRYERGEPRNWRFWSYALLWLLFLPNAPYIVTDLIHLTPRPPVPIWVDMIIIVSFAWTGILLGFLSLYLMQRMVAARRGALQAWVFVLLVLGLTGLGVYIGRFMRWNSWDIFISPFALAGSLWQEFSHPRSHPGPFLYSVLFAKLFTIAYLMLYALTHLGTGEAKTERSTA